MAHLMSFAVEAARNYLSHVSFSRSSFSSDSTQFFQLSVQQPSTQADCSESPDQDMDIEPVMLTIDMGPYDPPKALERRPLEKFAWFAHDYHTIPTVYGRIHAEGKVCKREESVPFPYHSYMDIMLSIIDGPLQIVRSWSKLVYPGVNHNFHMAHVFGPNQPHRLVGWVEWTQEAYHASTKTTTTEAIMNAFVLDPEVSLENLGRFAAPHISAESSTEIESWCLQLWRKILEVCSRNGADWFIITNHTTWVFGMLSSSFKDRPIAWTTNALSEVAPLPHIAYPLFFWLSVAITPRALQTSMSMCITPTEAISRLYVLTDMDDEGAIDDLEASDDELSDADLKRKLKLSQFHIVKRA